MQHSQILIETLCIRRSITGIAKLPIGRPMPKKFSQSNVSVDQRMKHQVIHGETKKSVDKTFKNFMKHDKDTRWKYRYHM